MQTPSRNSPPGWRIIIIGPRRTSNWVAKVHRVGRAPQGLPFSFAPFLRSSMFVGMTADVLLLSNFLQSCIPLGKQLGLHSSTVDEYIRTLRCLACSSPQGVQLEEDVKEFSWRRTSRSSAGGGQMIPRVRVSI